MSGWDVSSTPTWGSQDGPEDSHTSTSPGDGTRDFGVQGSPTGGLPELPSRLPELPNRLAAGGAAGGPPPEFFGPDYGQQDEQHEVGPGGYPQRTPGQSLQG